MDFEKIVSGASADDLKQAAGEIRAALAGAGEALPPVEKPVREAFQLQQQFDEADSKRTDYLLSKPPGALTAEEQKELTAGIAEWARKERR